MNIFVVNPSFDKNMTDQFIIETATPLDYPRLSAIWESSVRATHDFITDEDFEHYKRHLVSYFEAVNLFIAKTIEGESVGFIGIAGSSIEQLFVGACFRGMGVGTLLLQFAIKEHGADHVDVNEQNRQAVGFYLHSGFVTHSCSEVDSEGKPYPLLHLHYSGEVIP